MKFGKLWKFQLWYILYMAHAVAFARMRTTKTREHFGKFLYNAIASTDNTQHKNCLSSGIDDRPSIVLFRVLKRSPISQPHTLGLRRGYFDGKAVGNTTGFRRRLHLHWSKYQFLRSWHDPAEIRTTRTTTYQT